ncbi:molybdenum cofactor biosynthesis protein A [Methanocaldococcus bathoardescens]|uniref:Probable GTP 3',8-cyclase n=1 Tax=Methanocaldococcus bathoardescens TaxID=1301915 RepID=A0A076LGA7_9EURY|nr:GTP 3',8-cyclase MoaA [Methanocaldococcus bathoardescens]AIJ05922.1 molybdenum cofactor biosynthesis protein A [Methanocaldococcus bathoardescens]
MRDRFGREIRSFRISVTNKCNLQCFYCHKEGHNSDNNRYMTAEEIGIIAKTSTKFGVRKIKISGGEPLLRKDICEIIENIRDEKIKDISLTTNGILLEHLADKLKDAGLNRVNVSLDTLNPELYKKITKFEDVERVINGIKKAIDVGLTPLKVNFLAMSLNIKDLQNIMEFCRDVGAILQIIEFIPLKETLKKYYYDISSIENEIKEKADKVITRKFMQNRKKYIVDGLEIEFVRPMDNSEFCMHCTRIRLTYDGYLKPCLLRDDNLVDILTPLRKGENLESYFVECINRREPYFKL